VGATGTFAANGAASEADLVIVVGTRWSDFTTASKTAFQNPSVRIVNVNIADFDAHKHAGLVLVGDARATLEAIDVALADYQVEGTYREQSSRANEEWNREVERLYMLEHGSLPTQSEVTVAVNSFSDPEDVVVCAAGSMPGIYISSGVHVIRRATTSSMATRRWATRSPKASASRWRPRSGRCTLCVATAPT
jgi:3D-(3,5/4)-trihydroxycyclohexane-1,2-dione acylhydrolase (decyclizing)